jgi:hypothetical protein
MEALYVLILAIQVTMGAWSLEPIRNSIPQALSKP